MARRYPCEVNFRVLSSPAIETVADANGRAILRKDDPDNKTTQAWKYERVSRAAQDITAAMKANGHIENGLFEYQNTDATYITLPPKVRDEIWKSTGLGSDSLVWRNQIFDCNALDCVAIHIR